MAHYTTNRLNEVVIQTLNEWNLQKLIIPEEISRRILERSGFWSTSIIDGEYVTMVRLYAPVVRRQEVFLGNVLLNDFLFKMLPQAVNQANLGQMRLLLNDLENAYFLSRGSPDLEALREAFQSEILDTLPDLYFGPEDIARGIHGDVRGMLTFYKCNIEPFPTFIVPQAYLDRLLTVTDEWLRTIVAWDGAEALAEASRIPVDAAQSRRINVILSLLSFFYCQDGTEMQSFHTFLRQAMADGRLPANEVKTAFGVGRGEKFTKKLFNDRKGSQSLDYEALGRAINYLLKQTKQAVTEDRALEAAPQLGQTKMLPLSPQELLPFILDRVQIGYLPAVVKKKEVADPKQMACRFCGANLAAIDEKNILGGSGTGNRFNQSLKRMSERLCLRCALSSYLTTKRLGVQFDGIFPIPKLYNIIFHYGQHDDWEIKTIQRQIDYVLKYVRREKTTQELLSDLREIREGVALEYDVFLDDEFELDMSDWLEPALEVVNHMQQDVQAEVIPLGNGPFRLLVFILPQLRPGSKEGLDFVQKRFSHSRLAVFTLLGLLRSLCGCDGPYYFQSLPTLAPGHFNNNTLYVNGQAEQADDALRRYGSITDFARQVVKYRQGHSILADWILLAEKLEQDPLGTFSDVLRDSPIRGGDDLGKARYKRLSNQFVPGMAVVDATEYLKLFEQLQHVQIKIQS